MSEILLRIHGLLPYLFLVLMLVVLAMAIGAVSSGKFSVKELALARIVLILAHIQLLFGLAVLFLGEAAQSAFAGGMGNIMKDSELRARFVEHPTMMIIAVALITIGFARSKRADNSKAKNKNILIFFGIAFVLILSRIPYATWLNL
jgi:hypothetical protein